MLSQKAPVIRKEYILWILPPAFIIVNYFVFHALTDILGNKQGFFLGMCFYWFCCLLATSFLVEKKEIKRLLKITKPDWQQAALLLIPVLAAIFFGPFRERIDEATTVIIFLSLLYAATNAFTEELFWRGIYVNHFKTGFFPAVTAPVIWFGIWHYVPLSFHEATVSNFYFVLSAIGLGLCWGIIAYYTKSVFWSFISHLLVDWSGIGALYYFS
jgi:membrane protease YdiL (CAAX protease family)